MKMKLISQTTHGDNIINNLMQLTQFR